MSSRLRAGRRSSGWGISLLLLCLALSQTSCGVFPAYYDATTYKNLTDLKAEALFLYDTFMSDSVDEAKIGSVRLKLAQAYEYEKGKGTNNTETRKQMEIIQQMLGRHVHDRLAGGPWTAAHLANQKTNLGEAFDIAIATERLKNKNE